jgi:DNA-binding CsgD family transcriptional regulator
MTRSEMMLRLWKEGLSTKAIAYALQIFEFEVYNALAAIREERRKARFQDGLGIYKERVGE